MKTLSVLLIFIATVGNGQDLQKEINDQVWKPFIQNFNNNNSEGFMAIHSKDVVRSARDGKSVLNWNDYCEQQLTWDDREKRFNMKRTLELRFTERIAQKDLAVEVGIYKTTTSNPAGESQTFYGRFHVVHRKENGVWKILVDTDSSEGNTIEAKDFLAAQPLE